MTWFWCGAAVVKWLPLMVLSEWTALSLHCWVLTVSTTLGQHGTTGPMDWLLSDKGPFHRSQEYAEFVERYQQGYTTRYKIFREFGRWKVNSLAVERRDFLGSALPLTPEFIATIRLLGRRPSLQQITDNIIKKYGTHFLQSATLGGEESLTIFVNKKKLSKKGNPKDSNDNSSAPTLETLHQLAASYFIDRESTLRKLHHLQIATTAIKVTETRTGPLGCSNYDNLDSVSSVLVQSPENKIYLQGIQVILPTYLRDRFVTAALGYISCNSEGDFICKDNDCWCQCTSTFPECNCPSTDIESMEEKLLQAKEAWNNYNTEFEQSGEFQAFVRRLPLDYRLNMSTIFYLWSKDLALQRLYDQLEGTVTQLHSKAQKIVQKLFNLSKRCEKQPQYKLPRERSLNYWLKKIQSLLYCNENNLSGVFNEELQSCACPMDQESCQSSLPCRVGDGSSCLTCSSDNPAQCGSCNGGYVLTQGICRTLVADSPEHYLGLETDFQDLEMKYLLQKHDSRIEVHAIFISNDMRLNSWFDPSWRKRMLLTLKSNKFRSNFVHMLLGLTVQICLTRNSTLEPVLSIYINPFGGSHSESWLLPVHENSFPDWERTTLDGVPQCTNWTLILGNKWKTFFETVHIYLRSRIKATDAISNETIYYEPLEFIDPSRNLGYMKINSVQTYGYSMHFDPEAIRDLILQLDYPYTQGSQHSALLQLLEIRDRVNMRSLPGKQRLDFFSCMLRHRLKMSASDVVRISDSLKAFAARLPHAVEYETTKLCS
ncbi:BMP/retinoic acid-inducible neural-specific protein 3-like [Erpetoichthys calabaricus]|uniref:BMP/retinoic acid-inducible neural-specific protein 3-like n=1 Tax=Erpetoichthys calabaricus TaxID=27687 RepID=UPI002233F5E9|nr:BMP/retinoic acid-inducible neural-specific protein 3-like [Erpetoichthys calabaricus]